MSKRYHPNPDQVAFADSVGQSLVSILPLSRLHDAFEESASTWTALSDLGVFGITAPEEHGGSALGATEEALIVLGLGRRAVAPSVLATLGALHLSQADTRLTRALAAGQQRVAAGYRRDKGVVFVEDREAKLLLVRSPSGASLVERRGPEQSLDAKLWSSELRAISQPETALANVAELSATALPLLRLRLNDAAALAGLARAAQDMAVAYAGMREQFGRPIGSFQAIKHHCANMALSARCAADQVSFAAVALDDDGRDDAALQVESALYVAAAAALDNCGKNIQVHGGMGFSDEADPHLLLKRARVLIEIAGGIDAALTRISRCPASDWLTASPRSA